MSSNPLWDFSLSHYVKPDVSRLCLQLQDEAGANVNVLLLALWLGDQGRAFEPRLLERSAQQDWHQNVTLGLRQARLAVKQTPGYAPAFYERIKALELEAERVEQDQLYALLAQAKAGPCAPGPAQACENLQQYWHWMAAPPAAKALGDALLDAVFGIEQ